MRNLNAQIMNYGNLNSEFLSLWSTLIKATTFYVKISVLTHSFPASHTPTFPELHVKIVFLTFSKGCLK